MAVLCNSKHVTFSISPCHCLIITFYYWLIVMLFLIHVWAVHVRNHLNETSLPLCTVVDYCIVYHPASSRINPLSISSIVLSLLPLFYFDCSFPIRFRSRKHLLIKQNRAVTCNRMFAVVLVQSSAGDNSFCALTLAFMPNRQTLPKLLYPVNAPADRY